jgi:hypothetical protein
MSGTYQAWNEGAPGGGAESRAAVAAGVAEAMAAVQVTQREARSFFTSYGDAVSVGHSDVGRPGRMGDPDTGGVDASDG